MALSAQAFLPKGISDFKEVRSGQYHYVDKSLLIKKVLEDSAQVILLPRPRRFGKTLNLSLLRYFFERVKEAEQPERRALFSGLEIEQDARAMAHFARYPVVFLTLKDVKELNWAAAKEKIVKLIASLYKEHEYLILSGALQGTEARQFQAILDKQADEATLHSALYDLSMYLHRYHQQKVVMLIDEYDTPAHEAYEKNYYPEVIQFLRGLLSPALKDNVHIFRAVMTGILRITRESIFSSLNNLGVYSLIASRYATDFGFTEDEVAELIRIKDTPELLDGIADWYNGYRFAGEVIYNPWSVICYLNDPQDGLKPHWVNTSSNALIQSCLLHTQIDLRPELELLLSGACIEKRLDENLVMTDLAISDETVWNLLLFTGYLKAEQVYDRDGEQWVSLKIPNREIHACLKQLVVRWFSASIGVGTGVKQFLAAVLKGNQEELQVIMQDILRENVSYHDAQEMFFHGLVLGLLVNLSHTHDVRSNQESGFGRCDVLIIPKTPNQPGVVLEFKTVRRGMKQSINQALASAMEQIESRHYAAEIQAQNAQPIHLVAMAFSGKQVKVKAKALSMI